MPCTTALDYLTFSEYFPETSQDAGEEHGEDDALENLEPDEERQKELF